jgi:hypothetical protein
VATGWRRGGDGVATGWGGRVGGSESCCSFIEIAGRRAFRSRSLRAAEPEEWKKKQWAKRPSCFLSSTRLRGVPRVLRALHLPASPPNRFGTSSARPSLARGIPRQTPGSRQCRALPPPPHPAPGVVVALSRLSPISLPPSLYISRRIRVSLLPLAPLPAYRPRCAFMQIDGEGLYPAPFLFSFLPSYTFVRFARAFWPPSDRSPRLRVEDRAAESSAFLHFPPLSSTFPRRGVTSSFIPLPLFFLFFHLFHYF